MLQKNKKLLLFIIILLSLFCLFIYFLNHRKDYIIEYKVDDAEIKEEYHKEEAYYKFSINYKGIKHELISYDKYTNKRRLIKKIEDNNNCLKFNTLDIKLYDVCFDEEYYYKNNNQEFKEVSTYKNVSIANLSDFTFLLWDYHEFIYLNNDTKKTINLFNKDIYNLNLIYQTDNTLIIPNYNEVYQFSKVYLINKNSKVSNFKLRYKIYFDSYFLGEYNNKVYLYDKKNEGEYYLDLKKEDIYKTSYKIYENNKWVAKTNQSLKNNNLSFIRDESFKYELKSNKLYGNNYLVTEKEVNKIIKADNLDVFYISKDTLYYFNPLKGELPLLKYSEWEFNNSNMIFIFNK